MVGALIWALVGSGLPGVAPPAAAATYVAPGFQLTPVFAGLDFPSAVAFAPDGRVFVTETGGVIKAFDSVDDTTPTTVTNMSAKVHAIGDRGMLGLAVDPSFPARPYLYVTYTQDAPPGRTPPVYNDTCPRDPATGQADNCPATGRLIRLQVNASNQLVGETTLIGGIGDNYWCHHGRQHAIGHAMFGPDGALYVSSGEGSASLGTDYGQQNQGAINPCGDPPQPVGTPQQATTSEGGALRSQDLRTSGDPAQGSGAIIRVDPNTGAAMPGNPLINNGVPTDDRHIAYGLRNPFRFTFRPGTSEIWISDVGWMDWEEINRIQNPTDATVENFGWPCYEGRARQPRWDALDNILCEGLYAEGAGAVTNPYWTYRQTAPPDPTRCSNQGAAASAIAFSEGPPYPAEYNGALFVGDYVKGCVWALLAGGNGLPNTADIRTIASGLNPVELEIGPDNKLYVVNIGVAPGGGSIERLDFFGGNSPPVARATATPSSGPVPLTVNFSGSGSTDDQPTSQLTYAWDLDGDGAYDDATGVTTSRTYTTAGPVLVGLRVTDLAGLSGTTTVSVAAGNKPPTATILTPVATSRWASGDDIGFSGSASDPEDGSLGASSMRWSVTLFHCQTATDCHAHPQADRPGTSSGTFGAPEHEYPAYLEFRLTVTDSGGLTDTKTVRVDPRTVNLTFRTNPSGLELVAGASQGPAPLTVASIVNSPVSVTAPTTQTAGDVTYDFSSWSDGGAPSHDIRAGTVNATYTAEYRPRGAKPVEREWGENRYGTAANLSASGYNPGVDVVYVATGTNFADALAAGPAASKDGGPVLLVKLNDITDETRIELGRLDPDRIVIAGGPGVVSPTVADELSRYAPSVTRIWGQNRYGTAANIALNSYPNGANVVYVATGANFPDALAAGPAASHNDGPVLLVRGGDIPAETAVALDRLNPSRIVIAGGPGVVSPAVAQQLMQYAPSVTRQWGANRYATAAAISLNTFPNGANVVFVATGTNFPDALAAVPAASRNNSPVLLVRLNDIPPETAAELDRLNPDRVVIVGGPGVVSAAVEAQLTPK